MNTAPTNEKNIDRITNYFADVHSATGQIDLILNFYFKKDGSARNKTMHANGISYVVLGHQRINDHAAKFRIVTTTQYKKMLRKFKEEKACQVTIKQKS